MYTPPLELIVKYADLLVNFSLNSGQGIREGDVVMVSAPEAAKPLYRALCRAVTMAGGQVIGDYHPSPDDSGSVGRDFFETARDEQIGFFAEHYRKGLIEQIDHHVSIIAPTDKFALKGIDPRKLMLAGQAARPYMQWRDDKENRGAFTWTLALYGTEASAREAGMPLEDYWREIVRACYLDMDNPITHWRSIEDDIQQIRSLLDTLSISSVHIQGPDADLTIGIGEHRRWQGGGGRNMPSYEIFTSPDARQAEGWIRFNQPLYQYGNLITGIELHFADGRVTEASAAQNEPILQEMIATAGANRLGEFSLTDKRFSRIGRFMAETLFDENLGGTHGNTHIALGRSYRDCYAGNASELADHEAEELGFNDSTVHTDIISTTERTVTATLRDGSHKVIYQDGRFQV